MSKWGIEEQETINAMKDIKFSGKILNMAAGDGRFNQKLLEVADQVVAIDIDDKELETLEKNCPQELKKRLYTKKIDITKKISFPNEMFDGVFCTGTLHLFEKEIVIKILEEIKRVLKRKGKIVLDFATDIERIDRSGEKVIFAEEGNYKLKESIEFFKEQLKEFALHIDTSTFMEENLSDSAGYQCIKGNFLIISGTKK